MTSFVPLSLMRQAMFFYDSAFAREAKCPICLNIFTDPVLIPCGHSFCHSCLLAHMRSSDKSAKLCPSCGSYFGDEKPYPNISMARIVSKLKQQSNTPDESLSSRLRKEMELVRITLTRSEYVV